MTWEYKGLQGVTGGYKGLPGVTRGLQGVTRHNKGQHGVTGGTKDYRILFTNMGFYVFLHIFPSAKSLIGR